MAPLGGLLLALVIWAPAVRAQGDIPTDPVQALDAERFGPGILIRALYQLDSYRPSQAVVPATALLSHPEPDVARTAAWLLRRMDQGSGAAAAAAGVLGDAGAVPEARRSAAVALGELRSAAGQGALQTALAGDADEGVRREAALALGALHRPGAANALAAALSGDASPSVRAAAARALGDVPDSVASHLLGALGDGEAEVRRESLWAIGRKRFPGLLGNLLGALQNDRDCRVKAAAAWALSRVGDATVKDALRAAASGSCRLAAQAASFALAELER